MAEKTIERRVSNLRELRISESKSGGKTLTGYGAVWNSLSEDMGFKEKVQRGCFKKSLDSGADIRCLINHNADLIIARRSAGTLDVTEDDIGLQYIARLPDTQTARDLAENVRTGLIDGSSFGFQCLNDEWDKNNVRTLVECELFDCGPVTFPAYASTAGMVSVRSSGGTVIERVGLYRSTRSLHFPAALTDAQRRQRARALLEELGMRAKDDDAECDCPCESCKNGDCESCDCGGCDSLECQNDSCQCEGHRGVRRQRHAVGRTIVPPGTGVEAWLQQQQEQELFWARLQAKVASAR